MMKVFAAGLWMVFGGSAFASSIPTNLEFALKNGTQGQTQYRMADHRNSVFVFEIFSLSCGSCNDNAAYVDKLATEYKSNPRVQVLDAGIDSAEPLYREWIRLHAPNHPVIADPQQRVYSALRAENRTPQVFVVNCEGQMAGRFVGNWVGQGDKDVREAVEKALKTTCN